MFLKRKDSNNAQRRFPMVPEEVWGAGLDEQARHQLLQQILMWRRAAIRWLRSDQIEQLSSDMVDLLLWALGDEPVARIEPGAYPLTIFPPLLHGMAPEALPLALATLDQILDVLLWRARIVDFLADIWDTLGSPLFSMEECGHATQIFMPEGVNASHCPLCLQAYTAGEAGAAAHYELCPVQRKLGHDGDEV